MKTLIIVAAVLAALYFIGINSEPAASTAPEQTGKIVVVSLSCTAKVSYTDIKATIRNTGAVPIKFPSLFVQFGGVTEEGIAQPMTLPPGAMGTVSIAGADLHLPRGQNVPCNVASAQDSKGRSIL